MFTTTVDLSQEPRVAHCNVALPSEANVFLEFFTTLGCLFGSSGRYVYVYKAGFGNVALFQVVVLMEARITDSTGEADDYISALIARLMGLTWGPSGADRTQVGPMLAPWTLLSGRTDVSHEYSTLSYRYFVMNEKILFYLLCHISEKNASMYRDSSLILQFQIESTDSKRSCTLPIRYIRMCVTECLAIDCDVNVCWNTRFIIWFSYMFIALLLFFWLCLFFLFFLVWVVLFLI